MVNQSKRVFLTQLKLFWNSFFLSIYLFYFIYFFFQPFAATPTLKFTLKLKHGYHSAQDAMVVWAKGINPTGAIVCFEEFHAWSRYHNDYELVSLSVLPSVCLSVYLTVICFVVFDYWTKIYKKRKTLNSLIKETFARNKICEIFIFLFVN